MKLEDYPPTKEGGVDFVRDIFRGMGGSGTDAKQLLPETQTQTTGTSNQRNQTQKIGTAAKRFGRLSSSTQMYFEVSRSVY